ncbi:LegC family aminotransferase [Hahella aquimaris]|uniref:LegC family aminotransferase n=1 Tax=Hahella sp. HNIBRBA332 TaxID=3015983 RepID=UPI00273C28CF|nr:LegC family aminotransferase [Hahella sp. HNIBRBA332]WLQ15005.1 LegC family aminotransferase [Hahella sp. HNIBRBA332]
MSDLLSSDHRQKYKPLFDFIRNAFPNEGMIPLHEPRFSALDKQYVNEAIDSTFVSSVGAFVDRFERQIAEYTGAGYAVAAVNGTAALHLALLLCDVQPGDEVITQALTFVATGAAILYCQAKPVMVDVDKDTLGMSADALRNWLENNARKEGGGAINQGTGAVIKACVPVHVFGHPCRIDQIRDVCQEWGVKLVEDASESLGSFYKGRHTGTFGDMGVFSFNGNKVVTTGGGGVIVTNNERFAKRAKFLSTTAKQPHPYEFFHPELGYNYRLPNLNAALGCAQLEQLEEFIEAKRELAHTYRDFFNLAGMPLAFVEEPLECRSNYWLNAILTSSEQEKTALLEAALNESVQMRPVWRLLHELPMFEGCAHDGLTVSIELSRRLVNLPSSVVQRP